MDLKETLEKKARENGASFFGVADLTPATEFIVQQGGHFLSKYPVAISIGYRLLDGVVDELQNHDDPMAASTYWYHAYQVVNRHLDSSALDLAEEIQQAGYKATMVPSSYTVDTGKLNGLLSHKLASHLAGLGWIGRSAMLITPEHGPRVRWCTVLTDAPIEADEPFRGERCGRCTKCVDNCPVQAFTGATFDVVRPRNDLFVAEKCYEYLQQRRKTVGCNACGMCVYVCPYGRKQRVVSS